MESRRTAYRFESEEAFGENELHPLKKIEKISPDTAVRSHESPTGKTILRLANALNDRLERNNKVRHDVIDYTQEAYDRGKYFAGSIGRNALRSMKAVGKTAIFVPIEMTSMSIEASVNQVRGLGELVSTTVTDAKESMVEVGRDKLADVNDSVRAGLARTAIGISSPADRFSIWQRNMAESQAEKALSRLDKKDASVDTRKKNRANRIEKAEVAKRRKADRTARRELRHSA